MREYGEVRQSNLDVAVFAAMNFDGYILKREYLENLMPVGVINPYSYRY